MAPNADRPPNYVLVLTQATAAAPSHKSVNSPVHLGDATGRAEGYTRLLFWLLTEGRRTKGSQSWLDFSFNITADFYGPFDSDLPVDIQLILNRDSELVFDCYMCLYWCFDLSNGDWIADR